jgi:hypothetical protein
MIVLEGFIIGICPVYYIPVAVLLISSSQKGSKIQRPPIFFSKKQGVNTIAITNFKDMFSFPKLDTHCTEDVTYSREFIQGVTCSRGVQLYTLYITPRTSPTPGVHTGRHLLPRGVIYSSSRLNAYITLTDLIY